MKKRSERHEIIELAKKLSNETRSSLLHEELLYDFIRELISNGWDRNNIYLLVRSVQMENYENLNEAVLDFLYDIETSIIGDCHINCIFRFPGEPIGDEELLEYVRSRKWMKSEKIENT